MKTARVLASRARTAVPASILALLASVPMARAQTIDTWSLGKSGLWSVAGNWSAGVPNNGTPSGATYDVDIIDGTSTVTLNIDAGINDLTVGSGNTLAIGSGGTLTIAGPIIVNSGLLEATKGGALSISGATVTNTGGHITASGTDSVVSLSDATVTGGTLNSSGGGTITASDSTTLNGVTISKGSVVTAPTGNSTYISGTTVNHGTIQLDGGGGSNGTLFLNGTVTLTGEGTVTLAPAGGGGNSYIVQAASGSTLKNTNNTIQGNGIIGNGGLTVVNGAGGTISSDVSGGSLVLNGSGGLTNSGTLQVSSGALLQVTGPFTNFSGTKLAGGTYNLSGTLQVDLGSGDGEIVTNAAIITLDGAAAIFADAGGGSALTDLATNAAKGSFTLSGGADFTTAGNFTNSGTLSVGAGSIFDVDGKLRNFSGTTLTAGTYGVTGTLEFAGANIKTNDAAITLTGASAQIVNTTTGYSGLANFAANEAAGKFTLEGGADLTTAGSVSNAGTFTIRSGSAFTVGGLGVFTQTAGTTTDRGTLTASGGVNLSGGSLFASGKIIGNLVSSGIVTPALSATKTGILSDAGAYTQNSGGSLDIGIGGTTVGTTFDALKAGATVLAGTLNISQLGGFVPTVGSTFQILDFKSVTGTFTTVNGLIINSTEEYTLTYQPTDVLLTVVNTTATTTEESRLTAALQQINAEYAIGGSLTGRNEGMAPRPRLERIRAMDLVKKGAKQ
jgi:hypothetical protein